MEGGREGGEVHRRIRGVPFFFLFLSFLLPVHRLIRCAASKRGEKGEKGVHLRCSEGREGV